MNVTFTRSVPFGSRLRSLDGLRGIAVLLVAAYHALHFHGPMGVFGAVFKRFHGSAWAGVDLFFVLSGFLITGILLDSRNSGHYFRNFYVRRTLRIFPLYYAVLVGAIVIVPATIGLARLPAMYPLLIDHQLWLWTYTQNYLQATARHTLPGFGHFWSLAIEEQFYWCWPLVVYFLPRKPLLRLCLGVCAMLPVYRLVFTLSGGSTWAVRQYTHTRVDALLYGAIVAIVLRDPELSRKFYRPGRIAAAAAFGVLAVIAVRDGFVPYESAETSLLGYSAFGILFAVAIRYAVSGPSRFAELLSGKVLRWFGSYSYGIYVFHWPITQACQAMIDPRLARFHSAWIPGVISFSIVLAASSLVAYLSFRLYESQFLKLKKYFEYPSSAPQSKMEHTRKDLLALADAVQPDAVSRRAEPVLERASG